MCYTLVLHASNNMAHEPSIAVLNSLLTVAPQERNFHIFSSLPKEIRLQIWEDSIPRERLLRVFLGVMEAREDDPQPRYLEKNHLGKPISGPRYKAMAEGHQINSKFLRVNKEAREVALAFYRVHMPFSLKAPGAVRDEETTLYLNPEHDVLHLSAKAPVKETLIDFFWDMKAYDPKGVGLVKMAIDLQGFCAHDLQHLKRSDLLLIHQRDALTETLSHLRELWFVYREHWRSQPPIMRNNLYCHMAGYSTYSNVVDLDSRDRSTTRLDVVPITGSIPTFDRVGHDPRHVAGTELGRVYMGDIDPREIIWRWKRLLRTWDIRHQTEAVKYRLLVGGRPISRDRAWDVETADQAKEFVTVKDKELNVWDLRTKDEHGGEEEVCRERTVAVGYWLFPVEAVGEIGDGEKLVDMDFRRWRSIDMRSHMPELLLTRIN